MIELAAVFAGSFTLALSGALMPGPLLTITVSESARQGFKAGPLLITGHSLLELGLVLAVVHGLGTYLRMPPVMGAIALLGGSLLLYFGVDMVRTAGRLTLNGAESGPAPSGFRNPVLMGAATSVANPYWTLWWATIGLGYLMTAAGLGPAGIAAFFTGHIAADYAWYCLVSLGVTKGRSVMRDGTYRHLIRACGVFLIFFGSWFLLSARGYLQQALAG